MSAIQGCSHLMASALFWSVVGIWTLGDGGGGREEILPQSRRRISVLCIQNMGVNGGLRPGVRKEGTGK